MNIWYQLLLSPGQLKASMGQKKKAPAKRKKVGRPSRKSMGLKPTVARIVRVEEDVIEILVDKHGSLSNALRVMAGQ